MRSSVPFFTLARAIFLFYYFEVACTTHKTNNDDRAPRVSSKNEPHVPIDE